VSKTQFTCTIGHLEIPTPRDVLPISPRNIIELACSCYADRFAALNSMDMVLNCPVTRGTPATSDLILHWLDSFPCLAMNLEGLWSFFFRNLGCRHGVSEWVIDSSQPMSLTASSQNSNIFSILGERIWFACFYLCSIMLYLYARILLLIPLIERIKTVDTVFGYPWSSSSHVWKKSATSGWIPLNAKNYNYLVNINSLENSTKTRDELNGLNLRHMRAWLQRHAQVWTAASSG
jgi:hypothetical protein